MIPEYLMWFMRFGSPHLVTKYTLEDCYDLDLVLEDSEIHVMDSYGVLNCVEHIETGVISDEDWDKGLEAYREQLEKEAEEERADKPAPKPVLGEIYIATPPGEFRRSGKERFRSYTDERKMYDQYHELSRALGDRVTLHVFNNTEKDEE